MKRFRVSVGVALVGLLGTLTQVSQAGAVTQPAASATGVSERAVCGAAPVGYARCHAHVVTGNPSAFTNAENLAGYDPSNLQVAYSLPTTSTAALGRTVAIVDAYDAPNIVSDVKVYRSRMLPAVPPIDTSGFPFKSSSGPSFAKVNQNGLASPLPKANGSWAQEISLDVDMVSAICQYCNILLVEANSSSFADLAAAVAKAKSIPGVVAITNSYGGSEFSGESTYDPTYTSTSTAAITVSSGDNGYGVEYPAASPGVTAVGGTTLSLTSTGGRAAETAWSGAGSGCSTYETQKPSWQTDQSTCAHRTVADVSADADPNTGVSVYDSYSYRGQGGWMVFGGTSVASPIIASVYALAGTGLSPQQPYLASSATTGTITSLHDVTSGSNGTCGTYLCNAGIGYDGPTGLGTPNGVGAF